MNTDLQAKASDFYPTSSVPDVPVSPQLYDLSPTPSVTYEPTPAFKSKQPPFATESHIQAAERLGASTNADGVQRLPHDWVALFFVIYKCPSYRGIWKWILLEKQLSCLLSVTGKQSKLFISRLQWCIVILKISKILGMDRCRSYFRRFKSNYSGPLSFIGEGLVKILPIQLWYSRDLPASEDLPKQYTSHSN